MRWSLLTLCLGLVSVSIFAQAPQPDGAGLEPGRLPDRWPTAPPHCMEMQEYYVHEYNPNFYLMRQSACTDFEKPFLRCIPAGLTRRSTAAKRSAR
jgi:hydroxyacylglutathione hydrolase